mgnify:FL=1
MEIVKKKPASVIQNAARAGAGTASNFADKLDRRIIEASGLWVIVRQETRMNEPVLNNDCLCV